MVTSRSEPGFPLLTRRSALLGMAALAARAGRVDGGGENALRRAADPEPVPRTPQEVWAGFDPREEPLEIRVKRRWTENDADYSEFTFTGMTHEGSRVRVYAISSAPSGGRRLPGVLHVHGGGQTVAPSWLKFWNTRGYAALTFNWGGAWPGRDREKVTDWGTLTQGNHRDAGSMAMANRPTVRASSWYLWTRVARRALTCLERMEEVDPGRLGVFGVSMGGSIVWPFAATDDRLKAACAIYGAGWTTYPDELDAPDPKADDPETTLVRCPVLFLNATNDQHGKMDWVDRTLASVPEGVEVRQAFTPRFRHHIAAEQGLDLPLWMETWLKGGPNWPLSPSAAVRLGTDGVPVLSVTTDPRHTARRVDVFYAVENRNPKNRYWRPAKVRREGDSWSAALPVLDTRHPLFAFANVLFTSGVCLSTNLVRETPSALGEARATDAKSLVIGDFSRGPDGWLTTSTATDPVPPIPSLLEACLGPEGRSGVAVSRPIPLLTHKVGDPKWRGPEGASLKIEVAARAAATLRVVAHEHEFALSARQFAAEVALDPGAWRTVTLPASAFRSAKGETLAGWAGVNMLEWTTRGGPGPEPVFGRAEWVLP